MKSILQKRRECLICKSTQALECHHVFEGSRRDASEKYGMKVWLCPKHHRIGRFSAHRSAKLNRALKSAAQERFEKTHTQEEFMRIFHKNYRNE